MIDFRALVFELYDAFSYATATSLMVIGICVIALLAWRWVHR